MWMDDCSGAKVGQMVRNPHQPPAMSRQPGTTPHPIIENIRKLEEKRQAEAAGLDQWSIGRTQNHTRKPRKATLIITDPQEITRICLNQPQVSAARMRESILKQNSTKP